MRKTAFSGAIFGICSTALLLIGLSGIRQPSHVLAHDDSADSSPPILEEECEWSVVEEESEWWRQPIDVQTSSTSSPDDLDRAGFAESSEEDMGMWESEALSGDAEVAEDLWQSDPASGYRYYYRFVPAEEDFGWVDNSCPAEKEALEKEADYRESSDLAEDSGACREESAERLETSAYSFVDEYSSEEAARYEMAQENLSEESAEGVLNGELQLTEEDYDPLYQKYYYHMGVEEKVGSRPASCRLEESISSVSKATEPGLSGFEQPSEPQKSAYTFDGRTFTPDYEADVAAAWLFAAARNLPAATEIEPSQVAEVSSEASEETAEVLSDEAYEDWDIFGNWEEESTATEASQSYDDSLTTSESFQADEAGEESSAYPSERAAPDEPLFDEDPRGFIDEEAEMYLEYSDVEELDQDEGDRERGDQENRDSLSEEIGTENLSEIDDYSWWEGEASWAIVNPEPIVASSPRGESSSATPLVFDTPWHGEPGENFFWLESEIEELSTPDASELQEADFPPEEDDVSDPGASWDLDVPGYLMGSPGSREADLQRSDSESSLPDASAFDSPQQPEIGDSLSSEFAGSVEQFEEIPVKPDSWDDGWEAYYDGEYEQGMYYWEEPQAEDVPEEIEAAEPATMNFDEASSEEVSVERMLRGLVSAAVLALPRVGFLEFRLTSPWGAR